MEEIVQKLFRCKEDGTLEVRKWITEVPFDAFNSMAEVCKENGRVGRARSAAMHKERDRQDLEPSVGKRGGAKCLHQKYHVEEH